MSCIFKLLKRSGQKKKKREETSRHWPEYMKTATKKRERGREKVRDLTWIIRSGDSASVGQGENERNEEWFVSLLNLWEQRRPLKCLREFGPSALSLSLSEIKTKIPHVYEKEKRRKETEKPSIPSAAQRCAAATTKEPFRGAPL